MKIESHNVGIFVSHRCIPWSPGVFYVHSHLGSYEDLIAEQLVGAYPLGGVPNLIMEGRRTHFYQIILNEDVELIQET